MPETCENCGETIGKLEVGHMYKNVVVCDRCIGKLRLAEQRSMQPQQGKSPNMPAGQDKTPRAIETKDDLRRKTDTVVGRLFFWFLVVALAMILLAVISSQ